MYYEHFGLNDNPFRNTPDTRIFFTGGKRGAILEALEYAISQGEGILKVVGEVGSGKTTICRMLETRLADNVETVFLWVLKLALSNPNQTHPTAT
jgi:MSHA biogenesis protein MshM